MRTFVFNGWAASPHAWDLCRRVSAFTLFSYIDQLDARPEQALAASSDRLVFMGWSMGGSTALRLAARNPDRVAGLILLATTPRMMEEKNSGWKGMSERRLEALRKGLELTHGEGFFGVPPNLPNPYMTDTPANLERGLAYLRGTDLRATLPKLSADVPVFIFQSDRDGIVRPSNADFLKQAFPGAHVRMIPGSDHALPILIPEMIDDALDTCFSIAAACSDPA